MFVTRPVLASEFVSAGTMTPFDRVTEGWPAVTLATTGGILPANDSVGRIIGASAVFVAADGLGMTLPRESVVAGTRGAKAEFVKAAGFGTKLKPDSVG